LAAILIVAALDAAYAMTPAPPGIPHDAGVERHPSYGMRMGGTYNCPNHFAT
jgi:hypothetical protein